MERLSVFLTFSISDIMTTLTSDLMEYNCCPISYYNDFDII